MSDDVKVRLTGEEFEIKPTTFEEAMQQNERLKSLIRLLEDEREEKVAAVCLEADPDNGVRVVVCAPTCDEMNLLKHLRHALADVAEQFLRIGVAARRSAGEQEQK